MYNLLLAIVIFLSYWRVPFRNLEQNALLNVFQKSISEFPLCGTFLESVLFFGRTKAILNLFFAENLEFQPLLSSVWLQPLLSSTLEAGLSTALPLYLCPFILAKQTGSYCIQADLPKCLLGGLNHICWVFISINMVLC